MDQKKVYRKIAITLFLVLGLLVVVFAAMLLFNVTDYGITIASFGATVMMILSKKKVENRKIIGAYIAASVIGFIMARVPGSVLFNVAVAGVASVIAMTVLEMQHAPAIGIAIAMVLNNFSFWTDVTIIFSILLIIGMAMILKSFIRNPERILNFVKIETEKINWDF